MKTLAAFAVLLVLGVVPARAEDDDKVAALSGEIELLELQRDVDKSLLREAMMLAGHARLVRTDTDEAKKRAAVEAEAVEGFIREKQEAVVRQTVELKKKAAELTAATQRVRRENRTVRPAGPPREDKDRPELIEKLEEAQVEIQLLQMQSQMYGQKLNEALNSLATAEFTASIDETQRGKADAARKDFNDFRKKYVDFSKKLRLEQEKVAELQRRLGIGGMGGMGGIQ